MGVFSFVKPGKKIFDTITSVSPKVNKTKKDELKSNLNILKQKTKASGAKLDQTRFEIKNKLPLTFGKSSKKTMSNTELRKAAEARKKEKKQETKTKHFYAPDTFLNKGGRVGLKGGSFPDLSGDGKTTMKDILMGRGVIPKPKGKKKKMMAKKSETPMDKAVKKKNKKRII